MKCNACGHGAEVLRYGKGHVRIRCTNTGVCEIQTPMVRNIGIAKRIWERIKGRAFSMTNFKKIAAIVKQEIGEDITQETPENVHDVIWRAMEKLVDERNRYRDAAGGA